MSSIKNQALTIAENYRNRLKDFSPTSISEKAYNYEFTVQNSSDKIKVQVYFGKKGVKTVLQGNTKSRFNNELESILFDQQNISFDEDNLIEDEPEEYVGADESGKGDFFGPLVTAAVYADKNDLKELKKIGAVDSKLLSDNQIIVISQKIKKLLGNKFIITSLNPSEYNKTYEQKKNLNKLLREEHQKNIIYLIEKFKTKNVIIDSFEKKSFTVSNGIKILQTEKAERFTGVAAASILARAEMVKWFDENLIDDEIQLPKGASTIVNDAIKQINRSRKINWVNFCKLHFKNFQNVNI